MDPKAARNAVRVAMKKQADFDTNAYSRLLLEAASYLKAAADQARHQPDWGMLKSSVWRLSQALHEIEKVFKLLNVPPQDLKSAIVKLLNEMEAAA